MAQQVSRLSLKQAVQVQSSMTAGVLEQDSESLPAFMVLLCLILTLEALVNKVMVVNSFSEVIALYTTLLREKPSL